MSCFSSGVPLTDELFIRRSSELSNHDVTLAQINENNEQSIPLKELPPLSNDNNKTIDNDIAPVDNTKDLDGHLAVDSEERIPLDEDEKSVKS